jgi:alkylation response protein AidB-like acyl-CoA dehydrogenase
LSPDDLEVTVESWVRDHLPAAWLELVDRDDRRGLAELRESDEVTSAWFKEMGTVGLTAPDWPVRYGGLELSDLQCAAVGDVLGRYDAGVPSKHFTAVSHAGPTVRVWGSDEMRDRLLPRIVDGTDVWCQMFSEPGAGSDLAGLATRARRDGDVWRVDGQKVWTSYARESQWAILVARADPDAPKHRGLVYFVLDMATPGIDIRPIRQITGDSEFNEVFLDDVQIPDEMRLGNPGDGWRVAVSTLMAERTGIGRRPSSSGGPATALLRRAIAAGWTDDSAVAQRLLGLVVRERAIDLVTARGAARSLAGESGPEGSITKLTRSELHQRVAELGQLLEGDAGVFWPADEMHPDAAAVLSSRLGTIAGGTSEILRNVLAERVLGLPKDGGVSAEVPWSQIRRS